MAFYSVLMQKQQKTAQKRLEALHIAREAIDQLKEGFKPPKGKNYEIEVAQIPETIHWDDGHQERVWIAQIKVNHAGMKQLTLSTILDKKAL